MTIEHRVAPLVLFTAILACAAHLSAQQPQSGTGADALYRQAQAPVEKRIDDLLGRMTLEEKVRQLDLYSGSKALVDKQKVKDSSHAALDGVFVPENAQRLFGSLGVGGIHDLYPTPVQANAVQRWVVDHSRLGIPALFIEEGLLGFDTGTVFPSSLNLAATWDTKIARQTGAIIAAEARATGVHMILGPVLDVAREPRWGRIEEGFGEDAYLAGEFGLAYVRGMQGESLSTDHTVISEPKHFVGHGSPEGGTNTSPVHIGERELRTVMLKSFEPALREGHAMGVMAAYHEIDGVPVVATRFCSRASCAMSGAFKGLCSLILEQSGACIAPTMSLRHPKPLSVWPFVPVLTCSSSTLTTMYFSRRSSTARMRAHLHFLTSIGRLDLSSGSSSLLDYSTIHL